MKERLQLLGSSKFQVGKWLFENFVKIKFILIYINDNYYGNLN